MALFGVGLNTSGSVADFVKNPLTLGTTNPIRPDDFREGFIIEEVSLSSPQNLVKIALVGNQMPMIPFTFGGSQKVVKDYYPGNPEAHSQVLGAREADFTIRGRFQAKKFSVDGSGYETPGALQEELDNMRRRGNIVKLSLGLWLRYAFILDTKWDMKNLADIGYEITFTVISLTEPKLCPVIAGSNNFPTAATNNLRILQESALEAQSRQTIPSSVPTTISGLINNVTSGIAGAVTGVLDFVDGIIATGEDITNSINRAVGVVKNAEATVNRFKNRLASISYNLSFAGIPVPARYSASNIISSRISTANDYSELLAKLRKQFQALSQTVPLSRYRINEKDTLQKISVKFYGNPDHWKKIYDHNKLTSTALTRGTVVEIPKL